jgi:hypothetical protein
MVVAVMGVASVGGIPRAAAVEVRSAVVRRPIASAIAIAVVIVVHARNHGGVSRPSVVVIAVAVTISHARTIAAAITLGVCRSHLAEAQHGRDSDETSEPPVSPASEHDVILPFFQNGSDRDPRTDRRPGRRLVHDRDVERKMRGERRSSGKLAIGRLRPEDRTSWRVIPLASRLIERERGEYHVLRGATTSVRERESLIQGGLP